MFSRNPSSTREVSAHGQGFFNCDAMLCDDDTDVSTRIRLIRYFNIQVKEFSSYGRPFLCNPKIQAFSFIKKTEYLGYR